MPEPAVDALPIWLGRHSAAFLGIGLELSFQRREFGKGRIRIRRLVPLAPLETFAMVSIMTSIMASIAVARRTILPLLAGMPFATVTLTMALTAAAAAGMTSFAGRRTVSRVRRHLAGFRSSNRRRRGPVATLRLRRTMPRVPAMRAPLPWTPCTFRTHRAARQPDFDHCRLGGRRGCLVRRCNFALFAGARRRVGILELNFAVCRDGHSVGGNGFWFARRGLRLRRRINRSLSRHDVSDFTSLGD
jgi:hypothetical protein